MVIKLLGTWEQPGGNKRKIQLRKRKLKLRTFLTFYATGDTKIKKKNTFREQGNSTDILLRTRQQGNMVIKLLGTWEQPGGNKRKIQLRKRKLKLRTFLTFYATGDTKIKKKNTFREQGNSTDILLRTRQHGRSLDPR